MIVTYNDLPSIVQELSQLGMDDGELANNPHTCLALNRAYQEVLQENIKRIELVLNHNRHRQVTVLFKPTPKPPMVCSQLIITIFLCQSCLDIFCQVVSDRVSSSKLRRAVAMEAITVLNLLAQ